MSNNPYPMNHLYPKLILGILIGCSPGLYAQSPGGVSTNLSLWVKAESAAPTTGGTLTGWTDLTHNNTFTLSGSGITTVTNIVNFHPVVRFTGGKLIGTTPINWSECTAIAGWTGALNSERGTVISPTSSGTATGDASRYYFRAGVDGGSWLFAGMGSDSIGFEYIAPPPLTSVGTTPPPLSIYTASGVGNVFTRNGLDARVGSLYGGFTARATTMNGPPQIGDRSTNDSKMSGDIAEIIVYSSNNATNRNKVESYLALKYGITLGTNTSTVNYTSSANHTFWTGIAGYQHNIFGIGSDLASGLTQSTSNSMNSGSGNGAGQSNRGNLVLTAHGSLSDQQFLMIGTDSAALTQTNMTAANGPAVAVGSKRLVRTWKAQNTGSVGAVTLSFDKTGIASLSTNNTVSNYILMIDNDGDGNFKTGTQTFIQASSLASSLVTFASVTLSNNVVFTIITIPSTMIPLAISWESFTANTQHNTVNLQWTVSDGSNIDRYEVERSADAINFAKTGALPANTGAVVVNSGGLASNSGGSASNTDGIASNTGAVASNTGSQSYQFQEQPPPGTYYYRIRGINLDGSYQLSPVRSAIIAGTTMVWQIRSNPIQNNELQLQLDWPQQNAALIRIANRQGNILLQRQYVLQQGNNGITIDVAGLSHGLYYVQVQTGRQTTALPFLK